MEPRRFNIRVTAKRQAFGRINIESLTSDIRNAFEYMLLEDIEVEVEEIGGTNGTRESASKTKE
jgi:hypothetical protein